MLSFRWLKRCENRRPAGPGVQRPRLDVSQSHAAGETVPLVEFPGWFSTPFEHHDLGARGDQGEELAARLWAEVASALDPDPVRAMSGAIYEALAALDEDMLPLENTFG